MGTTIRVQLKNPAILTWARETGGYSVEELAAYVKHDADEIRAWEAGEKAPTYHQLVKIANKLKRPLAAFFLPTIPHEKPLPTDFRAVSRHGTDTFSPATRIAFRSLLTQLRETRELLDDSDLSIVFSLPQWSREEDPETKAVELRKQFQTPIDRQLRELKTHYQALDYWRSILFDYGVITRICTMPIDDARAFCLFDADLAGIGLSNEDAEHARIFSLIHEVAHLATRMPGVSGIASREIITANPDTREIEDYCDRFAAAFLLPPDSDRVRHSLATLTNRQLTRQRAEDIGNTFHVSKYVVARRALDLGFIESEHYWDEIIEWRRADKIIASQKKARDKEKGLMRGSPVNTQLSYAGKRFARLVLDALDRQRITLHEASQMLSLNPNSISELQQGARW